MRLKPFNLRRLNPDEEGATIQRHIRIINERSRQTYKIKLEYYEVDIPLDDEALIPFFAERGYVVLDTYQVIYDDHYRQHVSLVRIEPWMPQPLVEKLYQLALEIQMADEFGSDVFWHGEYNFAPPHIMKQLYWERN